MLYADNLLDYDSVNSSSTTQHDNIRRLKYVIKVGGRRPAYRTFHVS